jgi:hypothetical protein
MRRLMYGAPLILKHLPVQRRYSDKSDAVHGNRVLRGRSWAQRRAMGAAQEGK